MGNGDVWVSANMSAYSITDRTPYPKDLAEAYRAIGSVKAKILVDGKHSVDHAALDPFIKKTAISKEGGVETIEIGRDLSATVSALIAICQDQTKRLNALETRATK